MLSYRVLTGIIAATFLFLVIWYFPPFYFVLFIAFLIAVSAWEWTAIMGMRGIYWRLIYVCLVLLGLYCVQFISILPVLVFNLVFWVWAAVSIYCFNRGSRPCGFQCMAVQAVSGIIILVSCAASLVYLHLAGGQWGVFRLLWGLSIVFATDIGAYFLGYFWGRHRFMSRVSPKKTVEGLVGGILLASLVAMIPGFLFSVSLRQKIALIGLGLFVAAFSIIGDLTVSLLKRQTGVKDSGSCLPGHGGLLDRVDSVAAGMPAFILGLLFLNSTHW